MTYVFQSDATSRLILEETELLDLLTKFGKPFLFISYAPLLLIILLTINARLQRILYVRAMARLHKLVSQPNLICACR